MKVYDASFYQIDFSHSTLLTDEEKTSLEKIQQEFRPVERAEFLLEYLVQGKITQDDFTTLTGIPLAY